MSRNIWKTIETKDYKLTVEEVPLRGKEPYFIATYWEKEMELEIDRTILGKFETSGGAMGAMIDKVSGILFGQ